MSSFLARQGIRLGLAVGVFFALERAVTLCYAKNSKAWLWARIPDPKLVGERMRDGQLALFLHFLVSVFHKVFSKKNSLVTSGVLLVLNIIPHWSACVFPRCLLIQWWVVFVSLQMQSPASHLIQLRIPSNDQAAHLLCSAGTCVVFFGKTSLEKGREQQKSPINLENVLI